MFTRIKRATRSFVRRRLPFLKGWAEAAARIGGPPWVRFGRPVWRRLSKAAKLLWKVSTTGTYLQWYEAEQPSVAVRLDRTILVRGLVVARRPGSSVSVWCDGFLVGNAELSPARLGSARLPWRLRQLYPSWLIARCSYFHYRLDLERLPAGARVLTVMAKDRTGRTTRVSLRTRQIDVRTPCEAYDTWRKDMRPSAAGLAWKKANVRHLAFRPTVTLFAFLSREEEIALLRCSIRSLRAQVYPDWELCVACDEPLRDRLLSTLAGGQDEEGRVRIVPSDFDKEAGWSEPVRPGETQGLAGLLDPGDVLEPDALFEIVYEFNRDPDTDLVYSDEDRVTAENGRAYPVFKPDWSPDLLLSMNYLGRLWLVRRELLDDAGGPGALQGAGAEYGTLLQLTERSRRIGHVRTVLYGRRHERAPGHAAVDGLPVLRQALQRRGIEGQVLPGPVPGTFRVRRALPGQALVSIVLPWRGAATRDCLRSLRSRLTYSSCEILVLKPGREDASPRPLEGPAVKVLTYQHGLSPSDALNRAVAHASGDYLLFLDAAEVVTADLVEALLEHAQRPEVAVVGGKVIDRQGRIYQAGLVLVASETGSFAAFQGTSLADAGVYDLAVVERNCRAVGSECLMVRRAVFAELGGFDTELAGREADLDFCLRAGRQGRRVVVTPHAIVQTDRRAALVVRHKPVPPELPRPGAAAGRGSPVYWERWRSLHAQGDPCYNPNLSELEGYALNDEPTIIHHPICPMIDAEQVRKILVVKLDHLGDLLVAVPAIRRLRQVFPKAEITALVGSWSGPLMEAEPAVDRVLTYDFFSADSSRPHRRLSASARRKLADWLMPQEFDLAIDLRWDLETRFLLQLSGATWTAGYAERNRYPWLTLAVPYECAIPMQRSRLHITQTLLHLAEAVAIASRPAVPSQPPANESADILPMPNHGDGPLVGIHPGAGTPLKRWPVEFFAQLADLFVERLSARIVLFGGGSDVERVGQLLGHMRHAEHAVSVAGKLGVADLAPALRRCDLFVGNDSGPGHLAAALGVPTLGVFAAVSNHTIWAPLGSSAVTIRRSVPCGPCHFSNPKYCHHDHVCMRQLPVEQVWEAALRALLPSGWVATGGTSRTGRQTTGGPAAPARLELPVVWSERAAG